MPTSAHLTRTCAIWRDRILYLRFFPGAEVSLEDAQESVRVALGILGGAREPLLVDIRRLRSLSAGARAHFAGPEASRVCIGTALLVASPISRAIGNFFLGFNRPMTPTRLFTDAADAEPWLEELRTEVLSRAG